MNPRLTWQQRKKIGDDAEVEFDAMMRGSGFVVSPTSQEQNITPELRLALLKINDKQSRELRFQPDRFLARIAPPFPTAYWEVKAQTSNYKNFSIELDHWNTNADRMRAGMKIVYAFRKFLGDWHANWMSNLIDQAHPFAGGAVGSGKPMVLIPCYVVPTLADFLERPCEK